MAADNDDDDDGAHQSEATVRFAETQKVVGGMRWGLQTPTNSEEEGRSDFRRASVRQFQCSKGVMEGRWWAAIRSHRDPR
ncbi:hypothetical protein ColLi_02288 [Colletotrichum liriopes]|uniref:Uncharacterized protein n=1 Tax=Colletotrichum liriopes TaxID=708192 RepID=A0AA37LNQ7_9PEZI|nr:hypothetical protein ColLi_02288 [Colletotrichum liriopes]